ncbi:unnamed protein product, partial [Mesorhabditis spiculigera]
MKGAWDRASFLSGPGRCVQLLIAFHTVISLFMMILMLNMEPESASDSLSAPEQSFFSDPRAVYYGRFLDNPTFWVYLTGSAVVTTIDNWTTPALLGHSAISVMINVCVTEGYREALLHPCRAKSKKLPPKYKMSGVIEKTKEAVSNATEAVKDKLQGLTGEKELHKEAARENASDAFDLAKGNKTCGARETTYRSPEQAPRYTFENIHEARPHP